MGTLTVSMAIFNGYVSHYQKVHGVSHLYLRWRGGIPLDLWRWLTMVKQISESPLVAAKLLPTRCPTETAKVAYQVRFMA